MCTQHGCGVCVFFFVWSLLWLFVFFPRRLCIYASEYNSIRWTLFYMHTYVYTYLSICLIFDIFGRFDTTWNENVNSSEQQMKKKRKTKKKKPNKHFKADKRKYTLTHIHIPKQRCVSATKHVAFWIFRSLSVYSRLPTFHYFPASLFVFVFFPFSSDFVFFSFSFSCIATYLYKRKKGTIGKSVLHAQCPWSLSIRGIITPTFICNCFLISVRLHSSNQSFSQTKLDDFPYQSWPLLLSLSLCPYLPRSLSVSQSWNVFITIPNVHKYQPLMNYTYQNKEKEKTFRHTMKHEHMHARKHAHTHA